MICSQSGPAQESVIMSIGSSGRKICRQGIVFDYNFDFSKTEPAVAFVLWEKSKFWMNALIRKTW